MDSDGEEGRACLPATIVTTIDGEKYRSVRFTAAYLHAPYACHACKPARKNIIIMKNKYRRCGVAPCRPSRRLPYQAKTTKTNAAFTHMPVHGAFFSALRAKLQNLGGRR